MGCFRRVYVLGAVEWGHLFKSMADLTSVPGDFTSHEGKPSSLKKQYRGGIKSVVRQLGKEIKR